MSAEPTPISPQQIPPESAVPPESDAATAGIRLLARLARVAEQTCQGAGISLPQYRLLVSAASGPQRASELAAAVGVSRPTLTSLVDGLEQANLLKRVPVATDRRGIRLELTEEGRLATARAERALSSRLTELINGEASTIIPLTRDLVSNIGDALDREGVRAAR